MDKVQVGNKYWINIREYADWYFRDTHQSTVFTGNDVVTVEEIHFDSKSKELCASVNGDGLFAGVMPIRFLRPAISAE